MMLKTGKSLKLIATDMDGTLLGSNGRVSARNLAALQMAHEQGIEVVVATGRRHCFAMAPLRGLELCESNALISSNGAVIRSVGAEMVQRAHMPLETARWMCEHARQFGAPLVLTFDTVGPTGEDTRGALVCEEHHDLHEHLGRWLDVNEPYMLRVARLEQALEGDAPIQMMMCGTVDAMRAVMEDLLEHPKIARWSGDGEEDAEIMLHETVYPERDLSILDILPAGVSKASALAKVGKLRGVEASEMMAIGDNWNDVPMLEYVGRPVLMANAPDDLLELAAERGWEIAPTNDEDGVAVVIEAALGVDPEADDLETQSSSSR